MMIIQRLAAASAAAALLCSTIIFDSATANKDNEAYYPASAFVTTADEYDYEYMYASEDTFVKEEEPDSASTGSWNYMAIRNPSYSAEDRKAYISFHFGLDPTLQEYIYNLDDASTIYAKFGFYVNEVKKWSGSGTAQSDVTVTMYNFYNREGTWVPGEYSATEKWSQDRAEWDEDTLTWNDAQEKFGQCNESDCDYRDAGCDVFDCDDVRIGLGTYTITSDDAGSFVEIDVPVIYFPGSTFAIDDTGYYYIAEHDILPSVTFELVGSSNHWVSIASNENVDETKHPYLAMPVDMTVPTTATPTTTAKPTETPSGTPEAEPTTSPTPADMDPTTAPTVAPTTSPTGPTTPGPTNVECTFPGFHCR